MNKKLSIFFLVFALLGFLDATYLTIQHFMGAIPPCLIADGCSTVLTSKWSVLLGLPVALWGAIYYLLVLALAIICLKKPSKNLTLATVLFSTLGFIASIWFVSLQLFVIKQICFYCTISALTSTALFITGVFMILPSNRKVDDVLQKVD